MGRFVEGTDRGQRTLFPECLDDWIGEDNAVRVIDVFVEELDLAELGFSRVAPKDTGRPAYHPSVLLKLYIYGYLNRVQSSRRLEREAGRNVEVMWLTGRLAPDHKTIADFRNKDNGRAIRQVCARFVALCRTLGLFAEARVAIDGSKFKAVNNRDRNFTRAKMTRRLDQRVALPAPAGQRRPARAVSGTHDQDGPSAREDCQAQARDAAPQGARGADAREAGPADLSNRSRRSLDGDQRSGVVGYNVQAAVDTKHHLIVAHEVTNVGTDRSQLARMAKQTKATLGADTLDVVADRGYFNSAEILACEDAAITVTLPKPQTSGRYVAQKDIYICPANERLRYRYTTEEKGLALRRYWTNACLSCAIKHRCTTGRERRITRWEYEHVLEAVQRRLDEHPEKMRQRRETVEHPFG